VAGGVIGGAALLAAAIGGAFWYKRRMGQPRAYIPATSGLGDDDLGGAYTAASASLQVGGGDDDANYSRL
jgi:hypothetical protein